MAATEHQHLALSFMDIPVEVRLQIYDLYMLNHIKESCQTIAAMGKWHASTRGGTRARLIAFESAQQDSPALMRACKKIATELRPVAAQHVRFVIGSNSLLSNPPPQLLELDVFVSLPTRCKDVSAIRHVHLEWQMDKYQMTTSDAFATRMLDMVHVLRQLLSGSDGNGSLPAVHTLTLTLSASQDFPVPGNKKLDKFMETCVDARLSCLIGLHRHCPDLWAIEFVGTFEREWLDWVEAEVRERQIKVIRGDVCRGAERYECCEVP
ncbi:hypothetical protein MN608_11608 [Microdochium nivale]|nr:hypothetical protein MN608_11608 [Microdochium nivale]